MRKNVFFRLTFVSIFCALFLSINAQTTWNTTGNSNITTSNFLGTTAGCSPLVFKTGNVERMSLLPDRSFLGIGISKPEATLHLHLQADASICDNGVIKEIEDGDSTKAGGSKLLQLTTPTTGSGPTNGFSVHLNASKSVSLIQMVFGGLNI